MVTIASDVVRRPAGRRGHALRALTLALVLTAISAINPAVAGLTPELQKQIRAATFEVVIKKPAKDGLTYEKPLPLELIPFVERTDAYWPIGTAFAIAPDTFVTAAHVMTLGVGSQFGLPGIRDSSGKVYTVDRILKFALPEDFAVFSVSGAPPMPPLASNSAPAVDDPVFAVGNALGEGVVIRDGLLTSFTPEAQDGKWKWLRFSAAASPGNSGGPLLDSQGRVIGVVAAKSPNENLNYALPVASVLQGSDKLAEFNSRESFGIPKLLQGTIVAEFKDSFPLPLPFPEFARNFRSVFGKWFKAQQARLVAAEAERIFPRGASGKMLAKLYASFDPSLVAQQDDGHWDARSCHDEEETPLPPDGRVWHCQDVSAAGTLFRIQYPGTAVDERRYHDSKEFMDLLLKSIKLPRMVGSQAVRVTSLGAAQQDGTVRDHYGRVWQLRVWSLGFLDAYVIALGLPTPDGYVGVVTSAPSFLLDNMTETVKFVADYLYLSYTGSLPQWHAFLDRRDLRPAAFERVSLQYDLGSGLRFDSPRLHLDSTGFLPPTPQTSLDLEMTYILDKGQLVWDVAGVVLRPDRDKKTFVGAYRQANPADDAGKDVRERWDHMIRRDGDFAAITHHDPDYKTFWVRTVASGDASPGADARSRPLYEVVYNTDTAILPRQMEDIQGKLAKDLKIAE